jgi:hypothetical protein
VLLLAENRDADPLASGNDRSERFLLEVSKIEAALMQQIQKSLQIMQLPNMETRDLA